MTAIGPGKAGADVDAGQHILGVGVQFPDGLTQPTLDTHPIRLGGVPDVHAPEVGAVGVGVADTLDYGHLPLVVQPFEGGGVTVNRQLIADGQHLIFLEHDALSGVVVVPVGIGHHCVHKVVAPGQLYDYQGVFVGIFGHVAPRIP